MADAARRAFWTQQMDEAYDLMQQVLAYPVVECGEPLAFLPAAAERAGVEVLFSQTPFAPGLERMFYLRAGLVESFSGAAREMNARGWTLKVEDAFRSVEMQRALGRKPSVFDAILRTTLWEYGDFPPAEFLLKRVAALVATWPKVGTHMSGSALDISVLRQSDGQEVARGGPYLTMSELSPMESPFVGDQERKNRREITDLMARHGFVTYPYEFWHYNAGDCDAAIQSASAHAARYGPIHFDPASGHIEPVADPRELLQPTEVVDQLIAQAQQRLASRE